MASEGWAKVPLSALADFRNGKSHGSTTAPQIGSYPVFGSNGIIGRTERFLYDVPVTVIGRVGAYCGSLHWSASRSWITDNAIAAIAKPGILPRYLHYVLSSLDLPRIAVGSAQPLLTQSSLNLIDTFVAPLSEQRGIAQILGAFDDKIELNRKTNATLEAIAQALFKSWFVDFEPARAKAEGRDTGLAPEIAALFPCSFLQSGRGGVPTDWSRAPTKTFLRRGLGGVWGDDVASPTSSVAVRCLRGIDCHQLAMRQAPLVPQRFLSEKQSSARVLRGGEIIVEGSGSFCGRSIYWLPVYAALFDQQVVYSNFCKRLDSVNEPSQSLIAWLHMQQAYESGELNGYRVGTAFPNFDIDGLLENLIVTMPPPALAEAFAQTYMSLVRVDLLLQSRTLAKLRDALIPRLISGELRIADAERVVGKSA